MRTIFLSFPSESNHDRRLSSQAAVAGAYPRMQSSQINFGVNTYFDRERIAGNDEELDSLFGSESPDLSSLENLPSSFVHNFHGSSTVVGPSSGYSRSNAIPRPLGDGAGDANTPQHLITESRYLSKEARTARYQLKVCVYHLFILCFSIKIKQRQRALGAHFRQLCGTKAGEIWHSSPTPGCYSPLFTQPVTHPINTIICEKAVDMTWNWLQVW